MVKEIFKDFVIKMANYVKNTYEDPEEYIYLDDMLENENSIIATESDIKHWSRCNYRYFLKKQVGLSNIPHGAIALEALVFQQSRKALFNIRSPTGRLFYKETRVGPAMKTLDELTREDLPTYLPFSAPESFGGAVYGRWMNIKDRFAGKDIAWNSSNQKFFIGKELRIACKNYYDFILENGPPIPGYINKDVSVDIDGKSIRVRIPEIRKGMIIDDPTLWRFNAESYDDKTSDINNSALVTLRIFAFTQLVSRYPGYARVWGVSEEQREKMSESEISHDVTYRHFNSSAGILTETRRTPEDMDVLRNVLDKFFNATKGHSFPARHSQCPSCQYAVVNGVGDQVCDRMKKGIKVNVPHKYFLKKNTALQVESEDDSIGINIMVSDVPYENREREPVVNGIYSPLDSEIYGGRYRLFLKRGDEITVSSKYEGVARGIGFEERAIEEMDRQLQALATKTGKNVYHRIDFDKDFKFAGQKKISYTISSLGYSDFEKIYTPE